MVSEFLRQFISAVIRSGAKKPRVVKKGVGKKGFRKVGGRVFERVKKYTKALKGPLGKGEEKLIEDEARRVFRTRRRR